MRRFAVILCGAMLAACGQTSTGPQDGRAAITTRTGGGFGGSQSTTIFADDTVRVVTSGPSVEGNATRETAVPGAYNRALAEVGRLMPAAVQGAETELCPDYGTDTVEVRPAINGLSGVTVGCPDADVSTLIRAINGATSAAELL